MSESVDDDLYWACHAGSDEDELAAFLRRGAKVNARVGKGKSMTPLLAAVAGGHIGTVQALFRLGADANATAGGSSPTPLHSACRNGFQGLVRILLENGADVDALDADQNTPADLAGKIHHHGIIRMLNDHKMMTLLGGGGSIDSGSSGSGIATRILPKERSLSDFGKAARELEGLPSPERSPSISGTNKKMADDRSDESGNRTSVDNSSHSSNIITSSTNKVNMSSTSEHSRSTSTDLQMLLTAHRQLTVRESGRDRRLHRIQDSVTEMQKGMNRFHTVVDGLRLLLVEQMRHAETKEKAEEEKSKNANAMLLTQLGGLKEEHRRVVEELKVERAKREDLEERLHNFEDAMKSLRLKEEEARVALRATRTHLERATHDKHAKAKELESARAEIAAIAKLGVSNTETNSTAGKSTSINTNKYVPNMKISTTSEIESMKAVHIGAVAATASDITTAITASDAVTPNARSCHGTEAQKRLAQLVKEQAIAQVRSEPGIHTKNQKSEAYTSLFSELKSDLMLFDSERDSEEGIGTTKTKVGRGLFDSDSETDDLTFSSPASKKVSKPTSRRQSMSQPELSETAIRRLSRTTDMLHAVLADPTDVDIQVEVEQGKEKLGLGLGHKANASLYDLWDVDAEDLA